MIGEAVMLNEDFSKASKGAQAIVIDGQVVFPKQYANLLLHPKHGTHLKYGKIIFIQWNKSDPRWKGEADGCAYAASFDLFHKTKATSSNCQEVELNKSKPKINFGEINKASEPKNNDGRKDCFWCASPTRKLALAQTIVDICTNCER